MYVYDPNLHVHVLGIKTIIIMWSKPSLVGKMYVPLNEILRAAFIGQVNRNTWGHFEGGGISRCGDISRKYGRWAFWKSSSIVTVWTTAIDIFPRALYK